jgi:hypothetical protein
MITSIDLYLDAAPPLFLFVNAIEKGFGYDPCDFSLTWSESFEETSFLTMPWPYNRVSLLALLLSTGSS